MGSGGRKIPPRQRSIIYRSESQLKPRYREGYLYSPRTTRVAAANWERMLIKRHCIVFHVVVFVVVVGVLVGSAGRVFVLSERPFDQNEQHSRCVER